MKSKRVIFRELKSLKSDWSLICCYCFLCYNAATVYDCQVFICIIYDSIAFAPKVNFRFHSFLSDPGNRRDLFICCLCWSISVCSLEHASVWVNECTWTSKWTNVLSIINEIGNQLCICLLSKVNVAKIYTLTNRVSLLKALFFSRR